MSEVKIISKEFSVPKSELVRKNLEIMNTVLFPVSLGKTHLDVLEFFIHLGGDINRETRAKAREHFGYTMANLGNYISDFRRFKCLRTAGPNWEKVAPGIMMSALSEICFSVTVKASE